MKEKMELPETDLILQKLSQIGGVLNGFTNPNVVKNKSIPLTSRKEADEYFNSINKDEEYSKMRKWFLSNFRNIKSINEFKESRLKNLLDLTKETGLSKKFKFEDINLNDLKRIQNKVNKNNLPFTLEQRSFLIKNYDRFIGIDLIHINDFFNQTDFDTTLDYEAFKLKFDKWEESFTEIASELGEEGIDYELVYNLSKGYKLVKLFSLKAYKYEGSEMAHCLSQYDDPSKHNYDPIKDKGIKDPRLGIYSIRNSVNEPKVTFRINSKGELDHMVSKANKYSFTKYADPIRECMVKLDVKLDPNLIKSTDKYVKGRHDLFNELIDCGILYQKNKGFLDIRNADSIPSRTFFSIIRDREFTFDLEQLSDAHKESILKKVAYCFKVYTSKQKTNIKDAEYLLYKLYCEFKPLFSFEECSDYKKILDFIFYKSSIYDWWSFRPEFEIDLKILYFKTLLDTPKYLTDYLSYRDLDIEDFRLKGLKFMRNNNMEFKIKTISQMENFLMTCNSLEEKIEDSDDYLTYFQENLELDSDLSDGVRHFSTISCKKIPFNLKYLGKFIESSNYGLKHFYRFFKNFSIDVINSEHNSYSKFHYLEHILINKIDCSAELLDCILGESLEDKEDFLLKSFKYSFIKKDSDFINIALNQLNNLGILGESAINEEEFLNKLFNIMYSELDFLSPEVISNFMVFYIRLNLKELIINNISNYKLFIRESYNKITWYHERVLLKDTFPEAFDTTDTQDIEKTEVEPLVLDTVSGILNTRRKFLIECDQLLDCIKSFS